MKKIELDKINIKSEKGFTMQDLIVAIMVFSVFVGIIGTLMSSVAKLNMQTRMTASATNYAILILEDIDKISYEQVTNSLASSYPSKFSIPAGFNIAIDVTNYNEGNNKVDLIKEVKLTITYSLRNDTEELVMHKLKIKEMS